MACSWTLGQIMTIQAKFSKSIGGIYPINAYKTFPEDAIDIPTALYNKFTSGQISALDVVGEKVVALAESPIDPRTLVEVTAFQAHAAIARSDLYDKVEALMEKPDTPLETKIAWRKSQYFKRLSPTVLTVGNALGLTEKQLDDLFALASTI